LESLLAPPKVNPNMHLVFMNVVRIEINEYEFGDVLIVEALCSELATHCYLE